jgi:hypothetical protein
MPKVIDLTGLQIEDWFVMERDPTSIGGRSGATYICRCKCGKTKTVAGQHLRERRSTKCRDCLEMSTRDGIPISSRYWESIKYNAERRDINFDITREDAYAQLLLQHNKCALTGLELVLYKGCEARSIGTASLDRIDSTKGYVSGNIQWVHKVINKMKQDLPQDQFVVFCSYVAQHNGCL